MTKFVATAFLCAKPDVTVYILLFMSWTYANFCSWGMALHPDELKKVLELLKDFYIQNRPRFSSMNQETKEKMVIIEKITGA